MSNGVAALHLVHEPAPAGAPAIEPAEPIELAIGATLIALADLSVTALREVQADGHITRQTRAAGGALVVQLYQARQVLGAAGFDAMARRQAGRLCRRHGHLSATAADAIIGDAIRLAVEVDATMKAWMH